MKPSHLKQALLTTYQAKKPAFIWGPPGIGKSDIVQQLADDLFAKKFGYTIDDEGNPHPPTGFDTERPYLIDIRLLLLDPVDLRGIPRLNGDNLAHWCPPDFLPKSGEGILFLDELPAAPPLVQAAAYQLVLNRKIGEYKLPDGWYVVAAGNRETDRAVTHRMPSPLANRFTHFELEVDLEDWTKISLQRGIRTDVIAFARFRPNFLFSFDPARNEKSFSTPRSLWSLSKILDASPAPEVEMEIINGTIGQGAGTEFLAFQQFMSKLPNIDRLLLNPTKEAVPTEPAVLYALSVALARRATDQTIDHIVKYISRIQPEFSVLTMTQAVSVNPLISNTKAFVEWCNTHADVLA